MSSSPSAPRVVTLKSAVSGSACLVVLLTAGAAQSLAGSNTVFGDDIVDGNVTSADIKDQGVLYADIKNGAITGTKILDGSVTTADIANDNLTGTDVDESTLVLPSLEFQPLQLAGFFGAVEGFGPPSFAKSQGMVFLTGAASDTQDSNCGLMATLPVGYRPANNIVAIASSTSGSFDAAPLAGLGYSRVRIEAATGNIKVCTPNSQASASLAGIEFPVGN